MCEREGMRERRREGEREKSLGPKPISGERGLEEEEAAKETWEEITNPEGGKLRECHVLETREEVH